VESEKEPGIGQLIDDTSAVAMPAVAPSDLSADPVVPVPQEAPGNEHVVVLALADLLPDAAGEVVLFADESVPVNLLSREAIVQAGVAESHVTATGVDVTGLHFYSFESGVTVYSPTNVLIVSDADLP